MATWNVWKGSECSWWREGLRKHWWSSHLWGSERGEPTERKKARGRRDRKKCVCFYVFVCVRVASSWGLSAIIRMNLKTGRGVPLNKTRGRRPQFHFLFQSKGGNSRFFRNSNQNQPSGKNIFITHKMLSFWLFLAFVGSFLQYYFLSADPILYGCFKYPLCAFQKCDLADVYLSSVSVRLFILLCTLQSRPWAELNLAVFVCLFVSSSARKAARAHKTPFPLIWMLLLLQRAKFLKTSGDGVIKGGIIVSRGVFNWRTRGDKTLQIILCLLSTMCLCF